MRGRAVRLATSEIQQLVSRRDSVSFIQLQFRTLQIGRLPIRTIFAIYTLLIFVYRLVGDDYLK